MKPQELNQDEQKSTNGGFLTDGLLGGSNSSDSNSHSGSGSSSGNGSNNNNNEDDSSSSFLSDLPLIGDIL